MDVPLIYSPTSATQLNTVVTINSSDPINPTVDLTLTGQGVYDGPHMFLQYSSHDWGDRRSGAYSRWFLPITNDGNSTLTITALTMSDSRFIVDESVVLPLTISSIETVQIGIWFHPEHGIDYNGVLTIISDAVGQGSVDISLKGAGVSTFYPIGTPLWSYMITGGYDDSPKAIVPIQDITGDGVDDVLIGSEDDYIRCFNGNASVTGDVLWATPIYAGYTYRQTCMTTIPDINDDGYQDLIVGIAGGDRSITAFSGKTGQQIWKHDTHEYGDGGWVYQVDATCDYNNDGKPDVLAATGDDGSDTDPRRVYCLNGLTGVSIWERPSPSSGTLFSVIGVEDFTGDGKPDVVTGGSDQQETEGRIFGINGANGLVEWTRSPSGTSVWGLMQLDDINGDGKKDIAAGDFGGMMLLLNAATGAILHYKNLGSYIILRLENMGDVNKDGYRDILVAYSGSQGVVLSGFDGEYIWTVPLADKAWNVANIGDISWDGYNDAIIGTLSQSNFGYFLDGTDGETIKMVAASDAVDALNAIPDIVGDSSMEMVMGARDGMVTCFSGGYDSTYIGKPDPAAHPDDIPITVFPNPFRDQLNIHIELDHQASVKMELVDMTGRFICLIREGLYPPGEHAIIYDRSYVNGQRIKPGMFYLKATTGSHVRWVKVIAE